MTSLNDEAIAEQAADWWRRRGEGGAEERAAFAHWLAEDERHGAAFDSIAAAWDSFDDAGVGAEDNFPGGTDLPIEMTNRPHRDRHVLLRRSLLGAGIAAAIGGGIVLVARHTENRFEFSTGRAQRLTQKLADGSIIELDANTRIQGRFKLGRREIDLVEGRAMFAIAHDPSRPFSVRTGNGTVTVLGTEFSVEYRNAETAVVLVRGRVQAHSRGSNQHTVDMVPGDALRIAASAAISRTANVDLPRALLWREGRLVFDNESLANVVARMNDYSRLHIRVADPASADLRINGIFQAGRDDAFLSALGVYYGLTVTRSGNEAVISSRKL